MADSEDWWAQIPEEDRRELQRETRRYRREQWWKALWCALIAWKDIDDNRAWRCLIVKFGCVIALLLHREMNRDIPGWFHSTEIGFWDYSDLYAGWECTCLRFHLKYFRYEIYSDGDWWM